MSLRRIVMTAVALLSVSLVATGCNNRPQPKPTQAVVTTVEIIHVSNIGFRITPPVENNALDIQFMVDADTGWEVTWVTTDGKHKVISAEIHAADGGVRVVQTEGHTHFESDDTLYLKVQSF